jgi:tetratricopeptide (TPR) repeat protein
MQLELRSSANKSAALALIVLGAAFYLTLATAQVLAAYFSEANDPARMKLAIRLDSANAEARYRLGAFELGGRHSPQTALPWLQSAAELEPHVGQYWADLAVAEQSVGQFDSAKRSLQRALSADPHTPQIAWQAANLYLSQGDNQSAMSQFHTVLQNDSHFTADAISTCWKIRPDSDYLLENVIPPALYSQFLQFLLSRNETVAASKVWQEMFSLQQSVGRQDVFDYVRYLLLHREAAQAARVWQEAASIAALQAYQPSSENLLVNGDFSLDMLNGGFDWMHQKTAGVSLALDRSEAHSSLRSLRMTFDGPGIYDAGISQIVAVDANTSYEFSAFYKAEDMDGAGGMQFAIQDPYQGTSFFASENLTDADFWKKTGGSFTTGPETELLVVRVVRVPSGSPIRGRLWIDGLQLVQSSSLALSDSARKASQ